MSGDTNPETRRWKFLANALGSEEPPHVLDIGANPLEDPAYKKLLDARLCKVTGFEPQLAAFKALEQSKSDLEKYYNLAVGDGNEMPLNIYRESGLTSVYQLDEETRRYLGRSARAATLVGTDTIPTVRLDDIADLGKIDLLKIDVQGAECMIFDNGRKCLANATAVITELRFFPLYKEEPLLESQMALLSELGFRFHKFLFIKNQSIGNSQNAKLKKREMKSQALDGDAVFVRDLRQNVSWGDDQIRSLALLADAVFGSYDLVLHCLDLLAARGVIASDTAEKYLAYLPVHMLRPVAGSS